MWAGGLLLDMLAYKAKLYGRQFITINPRNTTQTCSHCGFIMGTDNTAKLTLRDREWTCPQVADSTFVIGMRLRTFWQKV